MATSKKSQHRTLPVLPGRLQRVLKPSLIVIVFIAVLLQVRYDMYLFTWSAPGHDANNQLIVSQISSAIQGESHPAIVEPLSKKVYVPEANLVLPPYTAATYDVLYGKYYDEHGSVNELNVTTKQVQDTSLARLRATSIVTGGRIWTNNLSHVFDQVPNAQACTRGIHVVFSKQPDQGIYVSNKQLTDGRTMYLYRDSASCSYDLTPLTQYLEQAQSY